MIIIGIDPGLAETGWGVLEVSSRGDLKVLAYGSVKTSPEQDLPERLDKIHTEIKSLIAKFNPDTVAIEQIFFGANAKTAMMVGEARGSAILACGARKIEVLDYTPLQIKTAVTGYGRAEKQQIQKMIKELLNLETIPRPDHAADALACAYCHIVSAATKTHFPRHESTQKVSNFKS